MKAWLDGVAIVRRHEMLILTRRVGVSREW